jgi:hypothetical protein
MTPRRSLGSLAGVLSAAVLCLAALALAPVSALAAAPGGGGEELSTGLAELAKPALSRASPAKQAAVLGLTAGGQGGLAREGSRLIVYVRFERGAVAGLGDLRAAGAEIVDVSQRYQTVTAAALPTALPRLAAVSRVGSVSEVIAPIVSGADCGGAVRSEGDVQLSAGAARSAFGLDGTGAIVGILSDSLDRKASAATHAAGDVASGDLPGPGSPCGSTVPVGVIDDSDAGGTDEGRAMAQIVHDLAPGASLQFASATAASSQFAFAANIYSLRAAGSNILVDDVFYPTEPFFQDGPIAVAINDVTAAGAAYFSAAGNNNLIEQPTGNEIASWEAPAFRDSGACPAAIVVLSEELEAAEKKLIEEGELEGEPEGLHPEHCMDFDPEEATGDDTFGITVAAGATLRIDAQWAESWFGVSTDMDAFLLDEAGNLLEAKGFPVLSADDNVAGTEQPVEYFEWDNPGPAQTVQLVVNRFSGSGARLKVGLVQNGGGVTATEYPESKGGDVVGPTVFGHNGTAGSVSVAAVPFNDATAPEPYSSRGPVTHYFGPLVDASPATAIGPQAIAKPDVAATDCGATTFFSFLQAGVWRFCGTSAAAPHVAAVAALIKQANPSLPFGQLRAVLAATARPVGVFGPNAVGAGLVDAYAAVSAAGLPPQITITERPPPLGKDRQPRIGFASDRPVTFTCSLDASDFEPCATPFVPPSPLGDGEHGFVVRGVDAAGRGATSEVVQFRIDGRRPQTFFRKRPPKRIRTHRKRVKAVFRFGSNERDVTFACRIDGGFVRFCKPRLARRFKAGRHLISVRARDAAGNVDRSPAVYRFTVERLP